MKLRHAAPAAIAVAIILTGCGSTTGVQPTITPASPVIVDLIPLEGPPPPSQETVTIESVYDGDTYTLTDDRKIRVLGIDTPELKATAGDTSAQAVAEKCYGHEARDAVAPLLINQTVTITGDPSQGDKDRYGRLLRYVTLTDGTDVAAKLLDGGYARVYRQYPVTKTRSYDKIEQAAKAAGKGGWTACGWGK